MMAKLKAAARNALPAKDFAGPDRSYPIPNKSHARNALARASGNASPKVQSEIKHAVAKKFPGIKQSGGRTAHTIAKRVSARNDW